MLACVAVHENRPTSGLTVAEYIDTTSETKYAKKDKVIPLFNCIYFAILQCFAFLFPILYDDQLFPFSPTHLDPVIFDAQF